MRRVVVAQSLPVVSPRSSLEAIRRPIALLRNPRSESIWSAFTIDRSILTPCVRARESNLSTRHGGVQNLSFYGVANVVNCVKLATHGADSTRRAIRSLSLSGLSCSLPARVLVILERIPRSLKGAPGFALETVPLDSSNSTRPITPRERRKKRREFVPGRSGASEFGMGDESSLFRSTNGRDWGVTPKSISDDDSY